MRPKDGTRSTHEGQGRFSHAKKRFTCLSFHFFRQQQVRCECVIISLIKRLPRFELTSRHGVGWSAVDDREMISKDTFSSQWIFDHWSGVKMAVALDDDTHLGRWKQHSLLVYYISLSDYDSFIQWVNTKASAAVFYDSRSENIRYNKHSFCFFSLLKTCIPTQPAAD